MFGSNKNNATNMLSSNKYIVGSTISKKQVSDSFYDDLNFIFNGTVPLFFNKIQIAKVIFFQRISKDRRNNILSTLRAK